MRCLDLGREFAARGLIGHTRDIFHLTVPEVLGTIEGFGLSGDLNSLVALRKARDIAVFHSDLVIEEVRG
jgi:pyruvate,water dikinase